MADSDPTGAVSRVTHLAEQINDPITLASMFVVVSYVVITLDRRREGSPNRDDTQVGIKLVIFALMITAVLTAAHAAQLLLGFILGGFKGGWKAMRDPFASMIAFGGPAVALYLLFLPRTNYTERPAAERMAVGAVAAIAGAVALTGLDAFLRFLLAGADWAFISAGLASVGVWGGVAVLAILRLGALSGWRVMMPRAPQMPMMPPMSGPMGQPPQQGMPPLGGGYPPQQGGGWPGQ